MPSYFLAFAPEQKRLQQQALSILLAAVDTERAWRHACGYFLAAEIAREHLYDEDDLLALLKQRYERRLAQLLAAIPDDHDLRRALGRYLREFLEAEMDRVMGYPSIGLFGARFEQFLGDEALQRIAYEKASTAQEKRKPGPQPGKLTRKQIEWISKVPTLREKAKSENQKFGYAYIKRGKHIDISRSGFQTMLRRFPNI